MQDSIEVAFFPVLTASPLEQNQKPGHHRRAPNGMLQTIMRNSKS